MEDFKFKDYGNKEVIDGVTVVHNGMPFYIYGKNGEELPRESLAMYDANGNRFYSNFSSIEKANQAISELAEQGITAIVGPKAPMRDHRTGKPIPNTMENYVGVFIVSVPEKSDDFSSHRTK